MVTKVTFTPPTASASAVTLHDTSGTDRFLSKIDGLVGPPAPRDVTRVRPGVDGIVDQTAFLGERIISLEGEIFKASGGAGITDLSTISESLYASLMSPGRLEVTYENGTVRWCNAKLAGGVEVSVDGASRLVSYQAQLRAADPRWYEGPYATAGQSTTLTAPTTTGSPTASWTSSSTTTSYTGTAPTPLTITVTAPSNLGTANAINATEVGIKTPTAYTALLPSQYTSTTFAYPSQLIVGAIIETSKKRVFYSATRTATTTNVVAGQTAPLYGVSSSSEFPYLYPGTNTFLAYLQVIGSASVVLTGATVKYEWFNAYW